MWYPRGRDWNGLSSPWDGTGTVSVLQGLKHCLFHFYHGIAGLKALQDGAVPGDKELGEVPFDPGLGSVVRIPGQQIGVEFFSFRCLGVQPPESFAHHQMAEQRGGIFPGDIGFAEAGKGGVVVQGAEPVDLIPGSRSLVAELVAGEVQDLKSPAVETLVQIFKCLVLGGEAASCGGVDDEQHLVPEGVQAGGGLAVKIFDAVVVDVHECSSD